MSSPSYDPVERPPLASITFTGTPLSAPTSARTTKTPYTSPHWSITTLPPIQTLITHPPTISALQAAFRTFRSSLDSGKSQLHCDPLEWARENSIPGQVRFVYGTTDPDSLPRPVKRCAGHPASEKTHIRFYPTIRVDTRGHRTYEVSICSEPALDDPRNSTKRGIVLELLAAWEELAPTVLERQRLNRAKAFPGASTSSDNVSRGGTHRSRVDANGGIGSPLTEREDLAGFVYALERMCSGLVSEENDAPAGLTVDHSGAGDGDLTGRAKEVWDKCAERVYE